MKKNQMLAVLNRLNRDYAKRKSFIIPQIITEERKIQRLTRYFTVSDVKYIDREKYHAATDMAVKLIDMEQIAIYNTQNHEKGVIEVCMDLDYVTPIKRVSQHDMLNNINSKPE